MKYMLLTYVEPDVWDIMAAGPDDRVQATFDFMAAINRELTDSGELVAAMGLNDPARGKTVRKQDGAPVVLDGAHAETKEVFGGYWILDCESEERVLDIARRVADFDGGHTHHTIEIRTFLG